MLRHLQVPRLAGRIIVIRVDYLVRVISLLLLIGILTSCVPEEDAVESSSSGGGANLGGAQILWGKVNASDNITTVTFSNSFSEIPVVILSASHTTSCGASNISVSGFVAAGCPGVSWQAIGR